MFAYPRSRQRVLVSGVVRSLAGRPRERGFRVVEQIHSQAHSTESQKDLGILGLELLRADPVRERTLQFADALGDPCRLQQRGNRIRLQLQRGIVGVERRPGFVVQQVRRREVEVGAHQARVQPDGFLQIADRVARSILLKANRAQNRIGGRARIRGGEGDLGLLLCLGELPLLDQGRRLFERGQPRDVSLRWTEAEEKECRQ